MAGALCILIALSSLHYKVALCEKGIWFWHAPVSSDMGCYRAEWRLMSGQGVWIGRQSLISGGILKTTMLTSFPLMVLVELYMFYMFYMFIMVHFSMFRVEP